MKALSLHPLSSSDVFVELKLLIALLNKTIALVNPILELEIVLTFFNLGDPHSWADCLSAPAYANIL